MESYNTYFIIEDLPESINSEDIKKFLKQSKIIIKS